MRQIDAKWPALPALILLLALIVCCLPAALYGGELVISGPTMGTSYHIKIEDPVSGLDQTSLKSQIDAKLVIINQQMSTYIPDSEISTFNKFASKDWFAVSPGFAHVVQRALEIGKTTAGSFELTIGALVNLWGFGPQARPNKQPSQLVIDAVKKKMGYDKIHVRLQPPAIKKDFVDMPIDLSGIAKGYGVDQIAEFILKLGAKRFMVEIGGEVRSHGTKLNGQPWQIGIERPDVERGIVQKVLSITDQSMATSGDYRNFYEENGQRFSHLLDPTTGKPILHRVASVTVLAKDCTTADAYATAFMVLGYEKAKKIAQDQKLSAIFLIRTKTGFEEKTIGKIAAL